MRRYWERTADRAEVESTKIRQQASGSKERVKGRAEERAAQARPEASGASAPAGTTESRERPLNEFPPEVSEERTQRGNTYTTNPDDRIVP